MKDDKIFDDFLRKSLGNYKVAPAPSSWKGIQGKLKGKAPGQGGPSWLQRNYPALIITAAILLSVLFLPSDNREEPPAASAIGLTVSGMNPAPAASLKAALPAAQPQAAASPLKHSSIPAINNPEIFPSNPKSKATTNTRAASAPTYLPSQTFTPPADKSPAHPEPATTPALPVMTENSAGTGPLTENPVLQKTMTALGEESVTGFSFEEVRNLGTAIFAPPLGMGSGFIRRTGQTSYLFRYLNPGARKAYYQLVTGYQKPRAIVRKPQWFLGAWYNPEMMYNTETQKLNTGIQHTAGLGVLYEKGGILVETGLGLSFSRSSNDYKVNYNDFLGTYKDLDSISFRFDTVTNTPVPTFFYKTMSVYDTVREYSMSASTNRYTYLQVPLMLGVRQDRGRFALTLKTGPEFALMISKSEPGIPGIPAGIKLISVDGKTRTRLRTSWQFLLAPGCSYRFADRFSLSLEPMLRYYLKTLYSERNLKSGNPYSIGLRAGLLYEFK